MFFVIFQVTVWVSKQLSTFPIPLFMFLVMFQVTVWVNKQLFTSYPHFLYLYSCTWLCSRWQHGITNSYPLLSTFSVPLFLFLVTFQVTAWDGCSRSAPFMTGRCARIWRGSCCRPLRRKTTRSELVLCMNVAEWGRGLLCLNIYWFCFVSEGRREREGENSGLRTLWPKDWEFRQWPVLTICPCQATDISLSI